jgi:TonB family protein
MFPALFLGALLVGALSSGCTSQVHNTDAPARRPAAEDPYPEAAKRAGTSGRVALEFTCNASGRAHNVTVVESGGTVLDRGAIKLVSATRCTPGEAAGAPGRIGVIFQLSGRPKVPAFEDNRPTIVVTGLPLTGLPGNVSGGPDA